MKKKELRTLPILNATKKIFETAWDDEPTCQDSYEYGVGNPYHFYWFLRAKVFTINEDTILKVALFTRNDLINSKKEPKYEIFIDAKNHEYITYELQAMKWRVARIDNLNYGQWLGYGARGKYCSKNDTKTIIQYLNGKKKTPYEAIFEFQNTNDAGYRKASDYIDSKMQLIKNMPSDFNKWFENIALIESRYIYYNYSKNVTEGYCTHCKRTVAIKDPRYNKSGTCSNCKSKIIYKSIKKSGIVFDKAAGVIIQKTDEGYVKRYFEGTKRYKDFRNPELNVEELGRVFYSDEFYFQQKFKYGEFRNKGIVRWCDEENLHYHMGQGYGITIGKAPVYDKNIREVFQGTKFEYSGIDLYAKAIQGVKFCPETYLEEYKKSNMIEYLVKMKMFRLIGEQLYYGSDRRIYNLTAVKLNDMLKIKKEQLRMIQNLDPTTEYIKILQKANELRINFKVGELVYFGEKRYSSQLVSIIHHTTPYKMMKYLELVKVEYKEYTDLFSDYADYIKACEELQYNLKNEFILFPKNLKQAHDDTIKILQDRKDTVEREKAKRDYQNIAKMHKGLTKKYSMNFKGLCIVVPEAADEIVAEGQTLHHCVGTYLKKVANKETTILFVRRIEESKVPFFTMEIKDGEVKQCRGKNNCNMTGEVKGFVEKFKSIKLEPRRHKEAV